MKYIVKWCKNDSPVVEQLPASGKTGTRIIIRKLNKRRFDHLMKEKEIKKFRFVSLKPYNSETHIPDIQLFIDGKKINDIFRLKDIVNHKIKVCYEYNKSTKILKFQYKTLKEESKADREIKRKKINNEVLILDLSKPNDSIYDKIQEHFKFDYSKKDSKRLKYILDEDIFKISESWPSFKSEYWIGEGVKSSQLKEFGHGVKLYVNNYALYDYLNPEFDWLELSNISDTYVTSAFKLRNVLGYVNFIEFDENIEELEISDERGGFLESTALEYIMLGIRDFITRLAININVVMRSSDFDVSTDSIKDKVSDESLKIVKSATSTHEDDSNISFKEFESYNNKIEKNFDKSIDRNEEEKERKVALKKF